MYQAGTMLEAEGLHEKEILALPQRVDRTPADRKGPHLLSLPPGDKPTQIPINQQNQQQNLSWLY